MYELQGGRRDFVTGLYRFGARAYDPTLKRWTQPDAGGCVDGSNLY